MSRFFARALVQTLSRRSNNNIISSASPVKVCLRQSVRRNISQDLRCAVMNEAASLRIIATVIGAEPNLPRGWDDGIADDDGG